MIVSNCNNEIEYEYAAICLWTLSRFEHFKKCINTLSECEWAENTDLYVSVDYPPCERYREGHSKIVEYIESNQFRFKNVFVFKQSENLGAYRNADFIMKYCMDRNSKIVCIEDDLVFSKNYLKFVNRTLDHYSNNSRVAGVWGNGWSNEYAKRIEALGYNTYLIRWKGCQGTWSKTRQLLNDTIDKSYLASIVHSKEKIRKLRKSSKLLFSVCIDGYLGRNRVFYYPDGSTIHVIDYLQEIWNIINDCYFVVPTVPKVRNEGYDGSGEHQGIVEESAFINLDENIDFELRPCDAYDPDGTLAKYEKKLEYEVGIGMYIKALIVSFVCLYFGDKQAKEIGSLLDVPGKLFRKIKGNIL